MGGTVGVMTDRTRGVLIPHMFFMQRETAGILVKQGGGIVAFITEGVIFPGPM